MVINPVLLFKALGDETRLRLLNLLSLHEFNVNELVRILEMGQSRISRHLKILSDSGLVTSRRDGMWVFYSTSKNNGSSQVIETLKDTLAKEAHSSDDAERAEQLINDSSKAVARFFDHAAPHWDRLQREIFGDIETGRFIGDALPECRAVADLGCGTGALFPYLLEKAATIIGVDSSDKMLDTAGNKCIQFRERLDLRLGELTHLPLRESEVDCAVINMALHHLSSPEECLKDTFRVLAPEGTLVIMDFEKHSDESFRNRFLDRRLGFDLDELRKMVTRTGFTNWATESHTVKPELHIVLGTAQK